MQVESTGLHYFRVVADCGSIKKAAIALRITPSAIGRQIQGIEDEVSATLFERTARGMTLTDAGRLLYRYAVNCREQFEGIRIKVTECDKRRRGHVRLATVEGLAVDFLPEFIIDLSKEHPDITVEVTIVGSRDVAEMVGSGAVDIGVLFGRAPRRDLIEITRVQHPICLIVAPDHPLARKTHCAMKQLSGLRAALPNTSFGIRQEVDRACANAGIRLNICNETNSLKFAQALAARSDLATFLPRISAKEAMLAGKLVAVPIRNKGLEATQVTLVRLAGRDMSLALRAVLEALIPKMKLRRG